ncbi:MAG TPA: CoA-binding protein, partial [Candidatus Lokiarchaeia archaeon]|nr:CoA-binding protein [Candidatus Lokiarchaeia archaeon]
VNILRECDVTGTQSVANLGGQPFDPQDLDPFFNPKSVVIIGASRNTYTFSGMILKNLLELRYEGPIYLINPNVEEIDGVKAYCRVLDLPEVPDLGVVVLRDFTQCLDALGTLGVKHVIIESEVTSEEVRTEISELLEGYSQTYGMRIIGPSTIGLIDFPHNFSTSLIPTRAHILRNNQATEEMPGLSYLCQSGGLAGSMGWWQAPQNTPLSKVAHLGDACTVGEAEVLRYLVNDPKTAVISLFLRKISPELVQAVAELAKIKPILFKKVGSRDYVDELLAAGAMEVRDYNDLFEIAKLFVWCPLPQGSRVGIIGPSSGAIALVVNEMRAVGLEIGNPSQKTKEFILEKVGGSTCVRGNPVDYWPPRDFVGTRVCKVYHNASKALLADDNIDSLILALEFFSEIEFDFGIFEHVRNLFPNKPIITILIHPEHDGQERIIQVGTKLHLPIFVNEIERAVRGLALLTQFAKAK